jgi:hypothetical protein
MKVLVSHVVISRHLHRGIAPSRLRTCCNAILLNHAMINRRIYRVV